MSGDSLFGNGEYIPAPSISSQNDRKRGVAEVGSIVLLLAK